MKHYFFLVVILQLTRAEAQSYIGPGKAIDPFNYKICKKLEFSNGAVVCAHPLAAMVGAQILKDGGNAIDAAIATQLALAVVYPGAGNLGGGGFMVARMNREIFTLDFRETAPSKANKNMYLKGDGNANTNQSQNGHLACGIPGTIKGIFESIKYANLPFGKLIQPAITFAQQGFVLTQAEAEKLNKAQNAFKQYNTIYPVFVKNDGWKAGDTLIQKDLAKTLIRIKKFGEKEFYEGETARLIVEEMRRGNGIITFQDLKSYKTKYRKPLIFKYKNYQLTTMPPPSSGGVLLCQMLTMASRFPIKNYGYNSVKCVHIMAEAERRAFADRAAHLGDPDYWKVPLKSLTNSNYLLNRMKDFDSTRASKSIDIKAGIIESNETTHISITDRWGNIVSLTTTLNGSFGSKTVVGKAGFLLNNEMDDFSIKPGIANLYGAVGGEANSIEPGKRMLSSMTPTIVFKNNSPFLVLGTPGGTTIPTSVFQTIVDVVEFDLPLDSAVNGPKFHHQWLPDRIDVERDFSGNTIRALQSMGHEVNFYNIAGYASTIGRMEVIQLTGKSKIAVADKRGDDAVAGW